MSLYFIAIAPDALLSAEIQLIQKDFAERFSSVKSYHNFPHITIIPPFSHNEESESDLITRFLNLKIVSHSFTLSLNGFGCFPNQKNPVIFIKPINSKKLRNLHLEISEKTDAFHPHLTVAYRDLTFDNFEKAWAEYSLKKFEANFLVDQINLYKHSNKKWNLIAQRKLI